MQIQKPKRVGGFTSSQALGIGLLLLIPLIIVAAITHLVPTAQTFATSQTSFNVLRDSEFIGMENFDELFQDQRFLQSLGNTIPYVIIRMIIAAIIPALVGGLIGAQARAGRIINRILLSVIAVLIVPISLGILWRSFWSPQWGTGTSPVFNEMIALQSPDGAALSLHLLDTLIIIAIAAFIGGTAFIAVMRGRRKLMAGIGVGLLGVIIAGASGFLVFDLPFVLTRGGPANSTSTYILDTYQHGFTAFQFGYASAQVSILAVGAAIVGLILGVITIGFNLRLVPIQSPIMDSGNNAFSVASIPLLLIFLLPFAGLVVWGFSQALQYGAFEDIFETTNLVSGTINSIMPWLAIWFIHLPITFMAGLALGFFRPLGRIGTNILFIVLLMITIMPTEVLMFSWFIMGRNLGALDQPILLGLPWLTNGLSLLVFKMLFDGAHEAYNAALDRGESSQKAFGNQVMLPGILMAPVIGIILTFISSQSLLWAFISQNSVEHHTTVMSLMTLQNAYAFQPGLMPGAASLVIMGGFLVFLILFALIQIFVLERFKLEAGPELVSQPVYNTIDNVEPRMDSSSEFDNIVDDWEPDFS